LVNVVSVFLMARITRVRTKHKVLHGVAIIVGSVIGAGFLGIPAAVSISGVLPGVFLIVLIGLASMVLNYYVGEIVLRTRDDYQMVGLAHKYLGGSGKWLMFVSVFFGMAGALVAYTVAISQILNMMLGLPQWLGALCLTLFMGFFINKGIKGVGGVEGVLSSLKLLFFVLVIVLLIPGVKVSNLARVSLGDLFTPYGVVLFACLGYSVIPEVEKVTGSNKKRLRKTIFLAMSLIIILYALFAVTFVGNYGVNVAEVATESLPGLLGVIGNTLAVLAMGTAYLVLGLTVRDTYVDDFRLNKRVSLLLAVGVPFVIALVMNPSFLSVIGLTGAYTGGLTGVLTGLMILKVRKKKERSFLSDLVVYALITFFILGIIHQTLSLL